MFNVMGAALLTAESLKGFTDGFTGVLSDNLPVILPVAGLMFGLGWVLRRINKAKNGSI